MNYFESEGTDEITCPYCGGEDNDSREIGGGGELSDYKTNCVCCNKEIIIDRKIKVTYNAREID